jgi:hypothetical protein
MQTSLVDLARMVFRIRNIRATSCALLLRHKRVHVPVDRGEIRAANRKRIRSKVDTLLGDQDRQIHVGDARLQNNLILWKLVLTKNAGELHCRHQGTSGTIKTRLKKRFYKQRKTLVTKNEAALRSQTETAVGCAVTRPWENWSGA